MNQRPHTRIAPLSAFQRKVVRGTPWVLIDPALRAQCIAAYRAIRLLVVALFTLIGNPLCSRATTNESAVEIEVSTPGLSQDALRARATRRKWEVRARTSHASHSQASRLLNNQNAPKPQLIRLKVYRAHAPPRGEIPDQISVHSIPSAYRSYFLQFFSIPARSFSPVFTTISSAIPPDRPPLPVSAGRYISPNVTSRIRRQLSCLLLNSVTLY